MGIPWFESLSQSSMMSGILPKHMQNSLISNRNIQAEPVAVADIRRLVAQYPPSSRLGVRCLVPAVVDANGHFCRCMQACPCVGARSGSQRLPRARTLAGRTVTIKCFAVR